MLQYRLYIDESGDHTYKQLTTLDRRYLGLTGVLIGKAYYDEHLPRELEELKQRHFPYDPDAPTILVRSEIKNRRRAFYVLQDPRVSDAWEEDILGYYRRLVPHAKVFTVVIDKVNHLSRYPIQTFDPYQYALSVLLRRVSGYLVRLSAQADVMAEARGAKEDRQIQEAYQDLRTTGSYYGTASEYAASFPAEELIVRRKDHNVAGLQIADLIAYGQKWATVIEKGSPCPRPLTGLTERLNTVVDQMVNQYGRYLLV